MSATDQDLRLAKARERATIARLRFINSLQSTQRRLSPDRLKEDAQLAVSDRLDQARTDVKQTIRRHPILAISGVAGILAVLFWMPARTTALLGMRAAQFVWINRRLWRNIND